MKIFGQIFNKWLNALEVHFVLNPRVLVIVPQKHTEGMEETLGCGGVGRAKEDQERKIRLVPILVT